MKVVLAGFPRVGKTTVFQSLTGLADSTAARGAAARGIIRVPDARVDALSKIYRPRKTTNATVVFVDVQPPEVGSLDKAAVLSAPSGRAQDADAVAAVMRGFPDPYSGAAEPERGSRASTRARVPDTACSTSASSGSTRRQKDREQAVLERLVSALGNGRPLRTVTCRRGSENPFRHQLIAGAVARGAEPVRRKVRRCRGLVSSSGCYGGGAWRGWAHRARDGARSPDRRVCRDAGLEHSARDRFVQAACKLDLVSFLTAGEDEVRAWTITRGTVAQKAAGKILSDIEKGFIRAEVIAYEDFVRYGSEAECKKAGRARLEGKEYEVADGDIVNFRFNV